MDQAKPVSGINLPGTIAPGTIKERILMVKLPNGKKGLIIYAVILTAIIFATPIVAGVLNSFMPGETISSSEVNDNFSMLNDELNEGLNNLQDQIDNECQRPGQVVWAAEISSNGSIVSEYICPGLDVSIIVNDPPEYELTLDGLETNQVIPQLTVKNSNDVVTCKIRSSTTSMLLIECCTQTTCTEPTSFYVTFIRK